MTIYIPVTRPEPVIVQNIKSGLSNIYIHIGNLQERPKHIQTEIIHIYTRTCIRRSAVNWISSHLNGVGPPSGPTDAEPSHRHCSSICPTIEVQNTRLSITARLHTSSSKCQRAHMTNTSEIVCQTHCDKYGTVAA